jgi:hypothetical protein
VVLVAAAGLGAAACTGESDVPDAPRAFCRAADRYEKELEHQVRKGAKDVDRQIARVRDLVATAPSRIEADTRTFLDALERVASDPAVRRDPAIKKAVDNVSRFASQGCGVYKRSGGL